MRIPQDLKDADALLTRYGRWAMDRWKKQHCASFEHHYKPPVLEPEPTEVLLADFVAMDVQHALVLVPLAYRRVLHNEYIPKGDLRHRTRGEIRRALKNSGQTFEVAVVTGLRMFHNINLQKNNK
jgi:hypothetical protein